MYESLFVLIIAFLCARAAYVVPEVEFEAYEPQGLRVTIPDNYPGIKYFAFHAKINQEINVVEPGQIFGESMEPSGNKWIIYFPNVTLKIGDLINYWTFIQVKDAGYGTKQASWTVDELIPDGHLPSCQAVGTFYAGRYACPNEVIFEDSFKNLNKWVVEQYIPFNGPNFEFNYYHPGQVKIDGSVVSISPQAAGDDIDLRGTLDLRKGCTGSEPDECLQTQRGVFLLPPVKSGKIISKFLFRYGKIEIRAKLPEGDWIFPDISLVPFRPQPKEAKIWIAYARGNKNLVGNDVGVDIGGNLLFAGPITSATEPARSKKLVSYSYKNNVPFTQDFHTYTLIWEPKKLTYFIDGEEFGQVTTDPLLSFNTECYVSLGLGVGGINDFPNDFTSGSYIKPWTNKDTRQIKDFFAAKHLWKPTWKEFNSSLQIDYVRITALSK